MSSSPRSTWDAGRFLQTLNFFDTIPVISCLRKMFGSTSSPAPPEPQAGVLFDFSQPTPDLAQLWGALDDVVMGGVSASGIRQEAEAALFSGYVSTANSGGFASIRTRNFDPPLDLTEHTGLQLYLKGDGNRYKFLVRDEDTWDSIAYTHSFDTVADEWITVQIPFSQLIPVFRAKTVDTARPLDRSQIRSLQLMLSKFEYDGALNPHFTPGAFQLRLQRIAVY
ncbi:CIA30 family protein [Pseudanabaena sp. FACHB-2040]|uniref:CIA30 family protein n=1 Tax=Pseudanabaena sp. FACHB-2040 TaxID=2692859 RepID=UPI00168352E1|nr:CIA30 family protein [Pseudanabaena sp. FACHB-2040]MBD2259183.1 CIA30 family protein [Pseudanabaena sp. FACHB-2040]